MTLYLTGAGQTTPLSTTGEIYSVPLPVPTSTITIGSLPITFAGAADGLAGGIFQVNFVLPESPETSVSSLVLSTGAGSTNFIVRVK
jgi:uncharacterized protein (TIGR03437 family)